MAATTSGPDTSNSSVPQSREKYVQSHAVDSKLMFREFYDYEPGF